MGSIMIPSNSVDMSLLGDGTFSIPLLKPIGVVQGTWARVKDDSYFFNSMLYNDTHANNDEIYVYVMLSQGTYTLQETGYNSNTDGIIKFYLDSTLIATHDHYAGAGTFIGIKETTSIVVSAGKLFKFSIKVDGKNALSTDYYCRISEAFFIKTA